jgi:hypothetical protein
MIKLSDNVFILLSSSIAQTLLKQKFENALNSETNSTQRTEIKMISTQM